MPFSFATGMAWAPNAMNVKSAAIVANKKARMSIPLMSCHGEKLPSAPRQNHVAGRPIDTF